MPVPLNEAPVGVISVVSAEIVIDQDDENKKSISVELPEAVKNEGIRAGMDVRRCARDGGPSEAGHSQIDAAIKGTRRLSGIEIWTFADDEQEVTVRLEFDPTPRQITAKSKTASATFADPSLADLVAQSYPGGKPPQRQNAAANADGASAPDLIKTTKDEARPAADKADAFIRRECGDLRIINGPPPAQTMAQSNRARLGLPPHSEAFEKFIAGENRARTDLNRRMIGCATSNYSIYPTDLYD